jgi:hypothetical protein
LKNVIIILFWERVSALCCVLWWEQKRRGRRLIRLHSTPPASNQARALMRAELRWICRSCSKHFVGMVSARPGQS